MNESQTRAELIDPKLKEAGWGIINDSLILREYQITEGRIQVGGGRAKRLIADYILVYKGIKLAVVEAKSDEIEASEGVAQAKEYAIKLHIETSFATNGKEIYSICLKTNSEGAVSKFPTPDELWNKTFSDENEWRNKFSSIPLEGQYGRRFYHEIAINKSLEAIAQNRDRILLTLATGTGKTAIAFQISWKLFQARWNIKRDGSRRPRILFLADRNILADQAYNSFSAFPEDALVRIKPTEIRNYGKVPTNGSIFFAIFQTFMSGKDAKGNAAPYFGDYPPDYFDFIIIDECHRGGANDEGNWRGILEYFKPAVQLGLTATPKRKDNIDTYKYFGEPVYVYSLKEGINDGYLTPFRVKRYSTTIDDYVYTSDDTIIEGEVEIGKVYDEDDFNKVIEIKEREAKRVEIFLNEINQEEKTIVFCATQAHAAAVRDLINQKTEIKNSKYCVRVTANDGEMGEQYLREFQDNEKTIPTILTTSQKLSTGVDARNVRNIVLMRPIKSMIEFKQIIGRGTRLFDGKEYFTIHDFVKASLHFGDKEWDGEDVGSEECSICNCLPCICEYVPPKTCNVCGKRPCKCPKDPPKPCPKCDSTPCVCVKKIKIKLRDGKEREIQHMVATSFWSADGKPISAEEFLNGLFGELPNLFKSEEELRLLWSNPLTRKTLLQKLDELGYGANQLTQLQKLINAEKSDLFDVLEYVFNSEHKPITREQRVASTKTIIYSLLNEKQREFIDFVLSNYIEVGYEELYQDKLPSLLKSKYQSLPDANDVLGSNAEISAMFIDFQKYLYGKDVA